MILGVVRIPIGGVLLTVYYDEFSYSWYGQEILAPSLFWLLSGRNLGGPGVKGRRLLTVGRPRELRRLGYRRYFWKNALITILHHHIRLPVLEQFPTAGGFTSIQTVVMCWHCLNLKWIWRILRSPIYPIPLEERKKTLLQLYFPFQMVELLLSVSGSLGVHCHIFRFLDDEMCEMSFSYWEIK